MSTTFATAPRARLDQAIATGAAHLRPIWLAVRDAGCSFAVVTQGHQRFDIPTARPAIVLIGDDMHESRGPGGFHRKSLRRLLARCRSVSIVSSAPVIMAYAAPAATAVGLGCTSAVIETRARHEADWRHFVEEHAPEAALVIATDKPEGRMH